MAERNCGKEDEPFEADCRSVRVRVGHGGARIEAKRSKSGIDQDPRPVMVEPRRYMSLIAINEEHHTIEEKHEAHYVVKSCRRRDAVDLDRLRHSKENIDVFSSIIDVPQV